MSDEAIVLGALAVGMTAVASKVEAATPDPALAQLEALGFALVINRLKSLANTAPAIPAATIDRYNLSVATTIPAAG